MSRKGFTLIELLVVISIIGLLATIVMVSLNSAKDKAKYARAQSDIKQLNLAMEIYREDNGELPPIGDNCSACYNPPGSSWTLVIDALVNGGYIGARVDKDLWGQYYAYDDNDGVCCGTYSYICTAGKDAVLWTTDDYCLIIPYGQ